MIPKDDRRVAVLSNPDSKHTDPLYYEDLIKVLSTEEEACRLWTYLSGRTISDEFNPGMPIHTYAKARMEESSLSPSERLFEDIITALPGDIATRDQFIATGAIVSTSATEIYGSKLEDFLRHAADKFGNLDTLTKNRDKQIKIDGESLRPRIIRNKDTWFDIWEDKANRQAIKDEWVKNNGGLR